MMQLSAVQAYGLASCWGDDHESGGSFSVPAALHVIINGKRCIRVAMIDY